MPKNVATRLLFRHDLKELEFNSTGIEISA